MKRFRSVAVVALAAFAVSSGCSYFNPRSDSTSSPRDCSNANASTPGCDDTKSVGASPAGVPASPHE